MLPGATIGLVATPAMAFDRFLLCTIAGAGGHSLVVKSGERSDRIDLASDIAEPRCTTLRWAVPQTAVDVIADDGPVTVTSWASFRDHGGVALSNVGVIGAQLQHFGRTDDAVVATELRAYVPDLIVLAFGTNEGFAGRFDSQSYEAMLRAQIGRLRTLAPDVPILLLGAPDALSRLPALRKPGVIECGNGLFAPAALAQVRAVQRKVAGELRLAYWDWQARMGGPCSALRWVESGRMRNDYVHFTSTGGAALAQLLQADLALIAGEGH
jgi:lysophospholipase L1-like esterase